MSLDGQLLSVAAVSYPQANRASVSHSVEGAICQVGTTRPTQIMPVPMSAGTRAPARLTERPSHTEPSAAGAQPPAAGSSQCGDTIANAFSDTATRLPVIAA